MRFRSTASVPLRFEMDGVVFEVPVDGECDIPDQKAFAIRPMRLPLEPVPVAVPLPPAPKKPAQTK